MVEKNHEEPDSSLIASLSSPKSMQKFVEPMLTAGTNEYDASNLHIKETADFEAPMQQELPTSFVGNKSNPEEISVEQKSPISVSASLSSIDNSGLLSASDHHSFPITSHKLDESMEPNIDAIAMPPSVTPREVVQLQCAPLYDVKDDVFFPDPEKVADETPPALPTKVKEKKPYLMHRLHDRQVSLRDTRQKAPAHLSRSNSGKYSRTDNTSVDTTTHIESVKVAASRFGGSINWKTRRTEPEQESGNAILEINRLKKEISECKWQAEAAEAAKVSLSNEYEKIEELIEVLEHDLERAQAEELRAKEDLEVFLSIVLEIGEVLTSDNCASRREELNIIREQYNAVLVDLMLLKDESRKVQENYETLLIEWEISIRKNQETVSMSKNAITKVEDFTVELNKLKAELELARSKRHDVEKHTVRTSLARDEDCLRWECDLRQAEEELDQLVKDLSSVERLESMLETSSGLLLKVNNELAADMEVKLTEQSQGKITQRSTQDEVILPAKEIENCQMRADKARDEICALTVAAASLKTELTKEKAALSTMQQKKATSSITDASLKAEIQLAQMELEAVQTKEKESRNGILRLQKIMEDKVHEADKSKSIAREAQLYLKKVKEDMEHAKAGLSMMEFKLQTILKEMEAAKESQRLAFEVLRSLEIEHALNMEEQGSKMITLDLDEYQSLVEKSHQAEELVHQRTAAAIAQVMIAKDSESSSLSRLNEAYKDLEERKQALLAATERANKATKGKMAIEQELRKWREENVQRRKAGEASKSEHNPSSTSMNIIEQSGDTKDASKEDCYASVHPLLEVSAGSSPNGSPLLLKTKKTKKPSFFPRIIMFFRRKRLRAVE